jgi:hypothetical protein
LHTFKQILREFWIPFVLAALWTGYNIYAAPAGWGVAGVISTFGPAFFLASWGTGQVVRVRRQARTERGLKSVEDRLAKLADDIESSTKRMQDTIIGGDSYAYLILSAMPQGRFVPFAIQQGDYVLSNVTVRIVDCNRFNADMQAGNPFASDVTFQLDELAPGIASGSGIVLEPQMPSQGWNAFFGARNGLWSQLIRARFIEGEWVIAFVVMRDQSVIFSNVPANFPPIGEALLDDAPRMPPPES